MALGRYRQCLLTPGSFFTVPAIANSALVFQKMNNIDAELSARTILLKVNDFYFGEKVCDTCVALLLLWWQVLKCHCFDPLGDHPKFMIWRKDSHISTEHSNSKASSWWTKVIYATALRALHYNRCCDLN